MMKKTLLVGALTLLGSSAAMAEGFYVGAGVGGLDLNSKTVDTKVVDSVSTVKTQDGGKLGVNGVLVGGYEFSFTNRMVLGLEAFGNYTSAKVINEPTANTSEDLRLNYVYGARVLPGFQATENTSFYGILGVARGNFKTSGTASVNASQNVDASGSKTFDLNGYQLGLGTKTALNRNLGIRTDIIYTSYKDKTYTGTSASGASSDTYKITPSTLEANVAAVYAFG